VTQALEEAIGELYRRLVDRGVEGNVHALPRRGRRLLGGPDRDAVAGAGRRAAAPALGGRVPPPVVKVLNENVERLNALLFAPLEYALVARR
jgi:hypothetical protein